MPNSKCFIVSSVLFSMMLIAQFGHTQDDKEPVTVELKKARIQNILTAQTKAWNDGDLPKFMETYWKSDQLSFSSGGKTTFGWQPTLDNYVKGYAPPKKMGKLHFDELKIIMIEDNSALVLGQWHLLMDDEIKREGNFSLVVKNMEDGWKIIHDHSSELVKKDEELKAETNKDK